MANKLGYRDGGKTSEEGINRITSRLLSNAGVLDDNHLNVAEAGSPDNTVVVAVGDIAIGDNSPSNTPPAYFYHGWVDSAHAETVSANASGNPRIDVLVAFVDLTVVDSTNSDNPGALDFMLVEGTPAGTPAAPDDSAIQTAVGASNPWVALAQVDVANGFSSITNADITDLRPKAFTPEYFADKAAVDFVGEGLLWSQDSGLIGQMTSGTAFINGRAITKGYLKKTFTASKDTYIDLPVTGKPTSTDDLVYTEVVNDAAAPALAANRIRLAKVVTDGSSITGVTTSGDDNNGVAIRQTAAVATHDHTGAGQGGAVPPTGVILDYAGATTPSGYLLCYGQAISRTLYKRLFDAISTTWGVGDGSSTFNVPDLRDRVTVGKGNMGGSAAARLEITSYTLSTTNASTTATPSSLEKLTAGMYVLSANVPAGTTIEYVDHEAGTITLTANATATASGTTARFSAISDPEVLGATGGALAAYAPLSRTGGTPYALDSSRTYVNRNYNGPSFSRSTLNNESTSWSGSHATNQTTAIGLIGRTEGASTVQPGAVVNKIIKT